MGLFSKHVKVTVHGYTSKGNGADGRYSRQARENRKAERRKIRNLVLDPKTPDELCKYIERTYKSKPLPKTDELYVRAAEQLKDRAPLDLVVYNLVIMQGNAPAAWLEVFIEKNSEYLAFHEVDLECDDKYSVNLAIADIVNYFSASKTDKKKKTERYQLLVSVQ